MSDRQSANQLIWNNVVLHEQIVHFVDKHITFWKLPVVLGLAYLEIRRGLHQRYNLLDVPDTASSNQDLTNTKIDPFFGRNVPSDYQRSEVYL